MLLLLLLLLLLVLSVAVADWQWSRSGGAWTTKKNWASAIPSTQLSRFGFGQSVHSQLTNGHV